MRRMRDLAWPLIALLAVLAARRWLDVVEVRGRSMSPTLLPDDRLLVVRARPRLGDIVLAGDPRDQRRELIKRVGLIGPCGVHLHGDNPAASTDARSFGALPAPAVAWRVVGRYWPLARAGMVPAPPRIALIDEGGEPACTVPEALIAGH